MIDPEFVTHTASDGYRIHVTRWRPADLIRGRLVILHGVQSHGGWYHSLGRAMAEAGFETSFPDRRGSGANAEARGDAPSAQRLTQDVVEWIHEVRNEEPRAPLALAGISWGGKLAVLAAADAAATVDALALICPGLHPRVGVPLPERLKIAWSYVTNRRKRFPIPLSDPALFTASAEGQAFIANDPLGLHDATAGLLAASVFIDRKVARAPSRIHQPALLMLAAHDRIVDNEKTKAYFDRIASNNKHMIVYQDGHHTLEFEPDPTRYARDLATWLDSVLPHVEAERVSPRT